MRIKICFELTMPNRGSWNGRWSGEANLYAVVRDFKMETANKILECKSYHHSWGDGWGANVSVRRVIDGESRSIKRRSKGFCGYEWMIDNIVNHGSCYCKNPEPTTETIAA